MAIRANISRSIWQNIVFAAFFTALCLAVIAVITPAQAQDTSTGLIGHWPLDDGSGTTAADSLTLNDGTLTNFPADPSPNWVEGRVGPNALAFDGSDDRVAISGLNVSNASFTISAWAKRNSAGDVDVIVGQGAGGANNELFFGFRATDVFTCGFGSDDLDSPAYVGNLNWHHWVCSYDADTNARALYRDGALVANDTAAADYAGSGALSIGGSTTIASSHTDGIIDEVLLYNRALSAEDASLLYRSFTGPLPCTAAYAGVLIYNHEYDAMQYCNGTDWIATSRARNCGTALCGGGRWERLAFVTETEYDGNLGGVIGADAKCQANANAAGLSGDFDAWIADSDANSAPATRFNIAGTALPIKDVNGVTIANNWADLVDGSIGATLNAMSDGNVPTSTLTVSTNVGSDGTQASAADHCTDWSSDSGAITIANGDITSVGAGWSNSATQTCAEATRLYCFEQDSVAAAKTCSNPDGVPGEIGFNQGERQLQYCNGSRWITISPKAVTGCATASCGAEETELVAFIIDNAGDGQSTGGITGADASCQAAADAASLSGIFYAWLADSNVSSAPATRFNIVGTSLPILLPNGTKIADGWSDLIDGSLDNLLQIQADGSAGTTTALVKSNVAANGTQHSALVADHCGDWTTTGTSHSGDSAVTGGTSSWTTTATPTNCTTNQSLYCFEQYSEVGHWKLDDINTTALDSSKLGLDGTTSGGLDGSSHSVAGQVSTALQFDGSSHYIDLGTNAAHNVATDFTLSAWVNTAGGAVQTIFSAGNAASNNWIFQIDASDNLSFTEAGTPSTYTSSGTIPANTWTHVAITKDGDAGSNVTFYINGVASGTATVGAITTSGTKEIGRRAQTTNEYFAGMLDDIYLYNRALSTTEVADQYFETGGLANNCANPDGIAGELVYNDDNSIMQFCDGIRWVGLQ